MATETSSPVACVWWSTTRGAWGCQIGNPIQDAQKARWYLNRLIYTLGEQQ
jgi:hypothetical protein